MFASTQPLRIVIADGDPTLRKDLEAILTEAGCHVVAAEADGPGAVRSARRLSPDIALFDLDLPFLDGIEAGQLLNAEGIAPTVLLAAEIAPGLARCAVRAGITSFLSKPVHGPSLVTTLEMAVHGWRTQRQRLVEVARLEEELTTRELVGEAKSILIYRHGMKEAEAFDFLRVRSMNTRRKIRHVAREIVAAHEAAHGHETPRGPVKPAARRPDYRHMSQA